MGSVVIVTNPGGTPGLRLSTMKVLTMAMHEAEDGSADQHRAAWLRRQFANTPWPPKEVPA